MIEIKKDSTKNTQHNSKQPPSLVKQQLQSERPLTMEDEQLYAKTIRENFYAIINYVKSIDSVSKNITTLQKTVQTWERKEPKITPKKRRLDHILDTLHSVGKSNSLDYNTHLPSKHFLILTEEINFAKDILITANLRLVYSIARRYMNHGLSLADLTQEGCIGLLRAAYRFDYSIGKRFSTYASYWVRQSITHAISDRARTIRLPAHMLASQHHFKKMYTKLQIELGRKPTMNELSSYTCMPYDKMLSIIESNMEPMSLDEPMKENSRNLIQILENRSVKNPDDIANAKDLYKLINDSLATLHSREAKVLQMRFGIGGEEEHTLKEVGTILNVSGERVRQIEQEALLQIRHSARSKHMRCFLET